MPRLHAIAERAPLPGPLALLADHLDAVLRHGEALRAIEFPQAIPAFAGPGVGSMIRRGRKIEAVAAEALALELAIVLRLKQAQTVARDAAKLAGVTGAPLTRLIASAASQIGDADTRGMAPSNAFLTSRGMRGDRATIGEDYRIGGLVRLGDVMDSAAAALDLMDDIAVR